MSLVINHNMMAANVARNLNSHYANLARSTQRLSTGMRVNSAADDAAGLAIRELQRADIAALQQGARNANDAVSLIQVADGALQIIDEKLIRMKELAEQASTGSYDSTQRMMIESEYQAMASEITRIAMATDFNGVHLLDGSLSGAHDGSGLNATGKMKIHFGTGNDSAEDYYYIEIGCATAAALGVGNAAFYGPVPVTRDYYESLRDASAQKAYDTTYHQRYPSFYEKVYRKLTAGTPASDGAGIDAEDASVLAAKEAAALAAKYADEDKAMVAAAMDKRYDDSYLTAYLNAYNQYVGTGMEASAAHRAASADATKAAVDAVQEANKTVAEAGDVSSLTADGDLPPRNREGADAVIAHAGTLAEQAVYDNVYAALFDKAVTEARNNSAIIDPTSTNEVMGPDQILAVHKAVDAQAQSMANTLGTQVREALRGIYEGTYEGTTTGSTGYGAYYTQALSNGYPVTAAQLIAEKQASDDAWTAMESALKSGAAFGLLPAAAADRHVLLPTQFDTSVTINVPVGSGTVSVSASISSGDYTDTVPDIVYTMIGAEGRTYLDTQHGLNGGDDAMVDAARYFSEQFQAQQNALRPGGTVSTQQAAQQAITAITEAIVSKDKIRAHLGAIQNRLENTISNLNLQAENLQAAESRISDVDVATEMTEFTRQQILSQSAVAMLAQANSLPQMAMQLIGG